MSYSVGEVAALLDLTPSTLRYYESEGLLREISRSSGGRRSYSDADLEACRIIECLKNSGLSIKDIKAFMDMVDQGDASLQGRLELFEQRREALMSEIEQMCKALAILNYKAWYYRRAVERGSEESVRSGLPEEVPPEHRDALEYLHGRRDDTGTL
ncbi:MerR family transcriptional regulator [Schaalia sp. ZJ405]|uniref:MerR family transcriptional regulator n=1 Tax=Schaalia sp. ZJ405 TaxID=2709403 RepID=UPI0013ED1645|nr:MerR family transcriptional regulator [Schaalia sp. ZJ405]QPK82281.1 MerR family transcriptional regulator [Schaalia sp. ZJ405]